MGIIDLRTDAYVRYRGTRMPDGAGRILDCDGIVIGFNGIVYYLPKLAMILGIADTDALPLKGAHYDMRVHACRDRWPPRDDEDAGILDPDLRNHYRHYFRQPPPDPLDDDCERNNWPDCYMAGALWLKIIGRRPCAQ